MTEKEYAYLPKPGETFVVECQKAEAVAGGGSFLMGPSIVRRRDHEDEILRAISVNAEVVVARVLYPEVYKGRTAMLRRKDYRFGWMEDHVLLPLLGQEETKRFQTGSVHDLAVRAFNAFEAAKACPDDQIDTAVTLDEAASELQALLLAAIERLESGAPKK